MRHLIYTHNEQRQFPVTPAMRALVKRAVNAALSYEQFAYPAEVSVTFTVASHIRALNAQYREKDAVTDVLSFPLLEDLNERHKSTAGQMELSRSRWEILCCAWSVLPSRQKHSAILWTGN